MLFVNFKNSVHSWVILLVWVVVVIVLVMRLLICPLNIEGMTQLGVMLLFIRLVKVLVVVSRTPDATWEVCILSVLWNILGKVSIPPTRPGKLSCLAVIIVVHPLVIVGLILGAGPVRVKRTVLLVTLDSVCLDIRLVEILTNILVLLRFLLTEFETVWGPACVVRLVPILWSFL